MSVIESDVHPTVRDEDWIVRMQLRVDEDLVESCAHGLSFAMGVLSFHDARPRGVSGNGIEDGDQFSTTDEEAASSDFVMSKTAPRRSSGATSGRPSGSLQPDAQTLQPWTTSFSQVRSDE